MPGRNWIAQGAVLAALGVALGAYHAHGLDKRLAARAVGDTADAREADLHKRMTNWGVAVEYQMYHALALVAVGLAAGWLPSRLLTAAGVLFALGIALFCGLLYVLALGGPKILGAIVPLGGASFIAGWLALAVAARAAPPTRR